MPKRHCERIAAHRCALSGVDRYLRFGYRATDASIGRYVEEPDSCRDRLFGFPADAST